MTTPPIRRRKRNGQPIKIIQATPLISEGAITECPIVDVPVIGGEPTRPQKPDFKRGLKDDGSGLLEWFAGRRSKRSTGTIKVIKK